MAQKTIHSVAGFLPYGVDDDSILFRSSLTSAASFTSPDVGAAVNLNILAGGEFDSTLGYNPLDAGTLHIDDLTGYEELGLGFQVSFEVPRGWICPPVNDTTNGVISEGAVLTDALSEECFISALGTSGYTKLAVRHIPTGTIRIVNPDATLTGSFCYSNGKSDYVTVNCGYIGGYGGAMYIATDGLIVGKQIGNDATTVNDLLRDIYIGSQGNTNRHVANHYIRNLQISSRPPCFPVHPLLSRVGVLSDSMFNSDDLSGSNHKDETTSWTIRRELAKKGLFCGNALDLTESGSMYVDVNSGFTIQDTGTNDLSDRVADLLAQRPRLVLLRGGTNDLLNGLTIDATWDADLKTLLTSILAGDTVEQIVVGTIPSLAGNTSAYTAEAIAATQTANNYIKALPDWDSRISVALCHEALGGENPANNTFKGQISGYTLEGADIHLAGLGHYLHGKSYADAILTDVLG